MKHRLKSDPSVRCDAALASDSEWNPLGLLHQRWLIIRFELPDSIPLECSGGTPLEMKLPYWLFKSIFEPVPEPSKPVLVEDELEAAVAPSTIDKLYDMMNRAAAELRRLRKLCAMDAESCSKALEGVGWRNEKIENLTRRVQLLTHQRDEARAAGKDSVATGIKFRGQEIFLHSTGQVKRDLFILEQFKAYVSEHFQDLWG